MYVTYDKILDNIDVYEGDILDVSSDINRILLRCRRNGEDFSADKLIDSIQDKVGKEGTLLIRAWNWDFCRGFGFDMKKSPCRVGALGNVALKRNDFVRTKHPIYSYLAWGRHAEEVCGLEGRSSFGKDSVFDFLYKNQGKQLMLGSTMCNAFTFVHYVEEMTGIDYRYQKEFKGKYTDLEGNSSEESYYMNVRKLDLNIKMTSEKFADAFYEANALKTWFFDEVSVSIVDLCKTYPIIERDIRDNKSRTICAYLGQ